MKRGFQNVYRRAVVTGIIGVCAVIVLECFRTNHGESLEGSAGVVAQGRTRPVDPLETHVGNIDFDNTPLRTAIGILADRSRTNLAGDWTALAQPDESISGTTRVEGITATQPVSMHLRNATLGQALDALCDCWQLADVHAGIAVDPAGILLLGASHRNRDRSVRTIPRFYDASRLIGATSKFPPPAKLTGEAALTLSNPQRDERSELLRLVDPLVPFAGSGDVDCFGNRLMVDGYASAQSKIKLTLDRLRDPTRLSGQAQTAAPLPDPPIVAEFRVPKGTTAKRELQMWQQLDPKHAIVEPIPEDDFGTDESGWVTRNDTLEGIAEHVAHDYRWPLIVVRRGEEDDHVHIRRFRLESVPRAYDVSHILAHPEHWLALATDFGARKATVENALIEAVGSVFEGNGPTEGLKVEDEGALTTCWNGILLWRESPEIHRRIYLFLKSLNATGRLPDPYPEQP